MSALERVQWGMTRDLRASATLLLRCDKLPKTARAELCSEPFDGPAYLGSFSNTCVKEIETMLPFVHLTAQDRDDSSSDDDADFPDAERDVLFKAQFDMGTPRGTVGEAYTVAFDDADSEISIQCSDCLDVEVTFVSPNTHNF